ncbi:MAG TPA: bifunctional 2-keto-4-hydroxyglutarate aldolase/2-keto-3-deoxy-6-phosphogluconate aldolase [Armatimonadota bacterium]|jgi:2-dehydro-3-deoxyphosphogluconate aldolase/(4S)-4-hydroxy-2-oxoglutarate aldolase
MNKSETLSTLREVGIIPVVRATSPEEAMAVADAIRAGGIPILEITMTVPNAVDVIRAVCVRYGDEVVVGAGTVLDPETARACILAGARFVVAPSLNSATIEMCRRYSVVVVPGALTPTEVVTAWQAGADAVKVFPCSAVGGASYLKALKGPLPQIDLIPTGGVSLTTAADFIRAGAFALGVGGDLVDLAAIRAGNAGKITDAARDYVEIVRNTRGECA